MNILKRNSTTINIATFWENNQLSKYNFDPAYQRPSDVWSESKRSFLIDTILKNFPMPPIFLHQHIDQNTGKTMYDVIDGKQRLGAIINFINGSLRTPDDFNSDGFGDDRLAGIYFSDLESPEISEWKKTFWRYEITIEYIDTDQLAVVNNIFDRLNRNGEPLTKQELRNARYHATNLYALIKRLSNNPAFDSIFSKIQKNRLEHEEFVSELIFSLWKRDVITGDSPNWLDDEYERLANDVNFNLEIPSIEVLFNQVTQLLNGFDLNLEALKIQSLSHYYALWVFAMFVYLSNPRIDVSNIPQMLVDFYTNLRNNNLDDNLREYKTSMSAGTKSRSRRMRRINALLAYCRTGIQLQ